MRLFKDFVVPASVDEARAALLRLGPEGFPLAGATSLMFIRHKDPKVAVDLSRAGLAGIRQTADGFTIGAMTPIADLRRFRAKGWVLDRPAERFVTQQIRNMCTIGGNIVRVFAWSDFPVPLLALDAVMTIRADAEHRVRVDEFFAGQPVRLLKTGDLLVAVDVPALKPGQGFGYRKQTRVSADFSQATVAARVTVRDGRIEDARVALGAAVTFPCRLAGVEAALNGKRAEESEIRQAALQLGDKNWRGVAGFSTDYIRHVAGVAVGDALVEACREAAGR